MLGELLGKYRVVDRLGEGGMGVVYVGRHETLGNRVVVKVLRPDMSRDADMVQRFFNEAQAATSIRHPGIVQVFDFGTTASGNAYFVMELLEGQTLTERLKQQRLDASECCRLGRQIANVMQAAHAVGITHRDLKPDNLFLVADPEVAGGERVKVLDFGLAKLAGELYAANVHTRTDVVMGTPSYMSPEQCKGGGAIDTRADIYSLGCILFKMVCGRPPFLGQGAGEIVGAHLHVPPPAPQSLAPDLPAELAALILRMLEKNPDARPQTMAAVSQGLDDILRSLGGAPPRTSTPMPMPALAHPGSGPMSAASSSPGLSSSSSGVRSGSQQYPSSTTLGASAGMMSYTGQPRGRRLFYVLGGLVVGGAAIAISLVLAMKGKDAPTQRQSSFEDLAASAKEPTEPAAPTPGATAAVPAAPAPPEPPAPAVSAPPATAKASAGEPEIEMNPAAPAEIQAECQGYLKDRKYRELEQCAGRLAAHDPKQAEELKARAMELRVAVRVAGFEAAMRDKNLKRAKTELDGIPPGAPAHASAKRKYAEAEDQAIAELAVQLDRVKDRDCEEYNDLLTTQRAAKPAKIVDEAAQKTPCTPIKKK